MAGLLLNPHRFGTPAFNVETDMTLHGLLWCGSSANLAHTDGVGVQNWYNSKGTGDATQATSTWRPTYRASVAALNNKPALDFDGDTAAPDFMSWTFGSALTYPATFFVVAKMDSGTGDDRFIFDGLTSGARHAFDRRKSDNELELYGGTASIATSGTLDTNPHFYRLLIDGSTGTDYLFQDETLVASGDIGSNQVAGLVIGNRYNTLSTTSWHGEMDLLGTASGDMTGQANWSAMKSWITSYHGITLA